MSETIPVWKRFAPRDCPGDSVPANSVAEDSPESGGTPNRDRRKWISPGYSVRKKNTCGINKLTKERK